MMSLPELLPQMDLYSAEQFVAADFDPANPYRLFAQKICPLLLESIEGDITTSPLTCQSCPL
jgi:hypothetical protein